MRRLLVLLLLLALPVLSVASVSAQNPAQSVCFDENGNPIVELQDSPLCKASSDNPVTGQDGVIMRVVKILSWVIGVASILIIMLGGLKYITANGDSNAITSAKNTIIYALIGMVLFLFSQAIIRFVVGRL